MNYIMNLFTISLITLYSYSAEEIEHILSRFDLADPVKIQVPVIEDKNSIFLDPQFAHEPRSILPTEKIDFESDPKISPLKGTWQIWLLSTHAFGQTVALEIYDSDVVINGVKAGVVLRDSGKDYASVLIYGILTSVM